MLNPKHPVAQEEGKGSGSPAALIVLIVQRNLRLTFKDKTSSCGIQQKVDRYANIISFKWLAFLR